MCSLNIQAMQANETDHPALADINDLDARLMREEERLQITQWRDEPEGVCGIMTMRPAIEGLRREYQSASVNRKKKKLLRRLWNCLCDYEQLLISFKALGISKKQTNLNPRKITLRVLTKHDGVQQSKPASNESLDEQNAPDGDDDTV